VAGKAIGLSFANCCVGGVISLVGLGALVGVIIAIALGAMPGIMGAEAGAESFSIAYFVMFALFGVPIFIAVLVLFSAIGAYVTTYSMFTWNKLFRFAEGIDKGKDKTREVDVFNNPPQSNNNVNLNEGKNGQ